MSTPNAPPFSYETPPVKKTWSVGTLVYGRWQLVQMFTWMLWGDFCLYLMDAGVGSSLVTLQLKKYGASNTFIAIAKTSIIELLVLVVCPIVSTWSDRTRSRLGRRIPFMLFATPVLAVFLTLVGFSPRIAMGLKSVSPHLLGGISAAGLTIALITVMNVGYKFADTFTQSIYYPLWADVIPKRWMGTFSCLFRVFSTAGLFVFNSFVFPFCNDYPGAICSGAAALYLVSFLLLCWQVKEGQYPPPPPTEEGPVVRRAVRSVRRFTRECYTHPFYWKYYLFTLCFMVGFVPFRDFLLLYGQDLFGKDENALKAYGHVMAMKDLFQIGIYFCLGPIVDRLHPLRAGLFAFVLMFAAAVCSSVFIQSTTSFSVWIVITFCTVAIYQGATGALGPLLLPRNQYGQFCAASAVIFHLGQMVLTPVLGVLTDHFGNKMVFPWFIGFSAVGILFLRMVYLDWLKRGGAESYVPPSTEEMPIGLMIEPTPDPVLAAPAPESTKDA